MIEEVIKMFFSFTTILQQCQEKFFKVLGNSEAPWQP